VGHRGDLLRSFNHLTLQPAMTKKRSTINYLLSAIGLVSLATASAQPPSTRRFPYPIEKSEMPTTPAGLYRLETSP